MLSRAQSRSVVRMVTVLSVALGLASCALVERGAKILAPSPTPAQVYYAGVDGLQVYSEASTRSKVLGALSLHEKVTRTRLERGYAYVESAKRDLKGWVINAQLIWRLPTAPTTGAAAPEEAQPEEPVAPAGEEPQAPAAPEAEPAAAEPLPEATAVPAAPPSPKATPGGIAPSIFDPY